MLGFISASVLALSAVTNGQTTLSGAPTLNKQQPPQISTPNAVSVPVEQILLNATTSGSKGDDDSSISGQLGLDHLSLNLTVPGELIIEQSINSTSSSGLEGPPISIQDRPVNVSEPNSVVIRQPIVNTTLFAQPIVSSQNATLGSPELLNLTKPVEISAESQVGSMSILEQLQKAIDDYKIENGRPFSAPIKQAVAVSDIVPVSSQAVDSIAVQGNVCCNVRVNGACNSGVFSDVVSNAVFGDVITLYNSVTVTSPITIRSDNLTITAAACDSDVVTQQTIYVDMNGRHNANEVAAFHLDHDFQTLILENLHFTRSNTQSNHNFGTAFYGDFSCDLTVRNCKFEQLRSPLNGGSAIYLKTASNQLLLDSNTVFIDNAVDDGGCVPPMCKPKGWGNEECDDKCWGGGGAFWLGSCFDTTVVNVNSHFTRNEHEFGHGMGGGLFVDWMACTMNINGVFKDNIAADGGAIHIEGIEEGGILNVDGVYEGNRAREIIFKPKKLGFGSRGGGVRVREIKENTSVNFKGIYNDNRSDGKGGTLDFNNIHGDVNLDISASKNRGQTGGVANLWREFTGTFTINSHSTFKDNKSEHSEDQVLSFEDADEHLSEKNYRRKTKNGRDYVLHD